MDDALNETLTKSGSTTVIQDGSGLSPEVREAILSALKQGKHEPLKNLLKDLHPADVADFIAHLGDELRALFYTHLRDAFDPDILVELPENFRTEIFEHLSEEQGAQAIMGLESDDAVEVLDSLPKSRVQNIFNHIPESLRRTIERGLSYPEDSAGRLMQREVVFVPPHWKISDVKTHIKENPALPTFFYHVFVTDPRHHPIGKMALSRLLRLDDETIIGDVMRENFQIFKTDQDQEDVAHAFRHYGLVSAPVIARSGRLVGMITADDVVEVVQQEAEEDLLQLGGIQGESDFHAPVLNTAYWRLRWLLVTLVNSLAASYVISLFEVSIQKITALSFLMTINAAMGGNSGMQVVTVVVRALATKSLRPGEHWKAAIKEVKVGALTGLSCATVIGLVAAFWIGAPKLGVLLFFALVSNMLWAAFAGTLLPVMIHKMGHDPAVSAGPLLTTTTDVFGYAIFLGLATYFLL